MGAPLMSGFGQGIPDDQQIAQVTRRAPDNREINAAISQSVQEFPPAINTGAFFAQTVRGPILPPYGTKDRDRVLRLLYRNEYNTIIQGTVSAIAKKFITTPWEIKGDPKDEKKLIWLPDAFGRLRSISIIEHYQLVLQNAQFGAGWEAFASRLLEDFFTQDFGGVLELIGAGEPIGPIEGAVTGIAQLDSGRCFITGNPYYPIMYFSLISGSLHRMHTARIVRFVDSPSPDERFFGIGLCALSRAIAIYNRQYYMSRYIESLVDDKPPPGIMTVTGMTTPQREKLLATYETRQETPDSRPFWGKTLWFDSLNLDQPIKLEAHPFATTPEKFDWQKYNSLDVDAIALAFGVDRQEIWELAGRGLGSGSQSKVMADKASQKMFGFLLQNTERLINRRVLPSALEFSFSYKDPNEQQNIATQNLAIAQTIQAVAPLANMSIDEQRAYLANASQQFKDVLTNEAGQVTPLNGQDRQPDVSLTDDSPVDQGQIEQNINLGGGGTTPQQPGVQPAQQSKPSTSSEPTTPKPATTQKSFGITSSDFAQRFSSLAILAVNNRLERGEFEDTLLDLLTTAGTDSFVDGLRSGGVNSELDDEDKNILSDWLSDQIDFVDGLAAEIYSGGLPENSIKIRSEMWVNKSLRQMFNAGRLSADSNGMYEWVLGDTEKHCTDEDGPVNCTRLAGQRHRLSRWAERGLTPPSSLTACGGWQCACYLIRTDQPAQGRF